MRACNYIIAVLRGNVAFCVLTIKIVLRIIIRCHACIAWWRRKHVCFIHKPCSNSVVYSIDRSIDWRNGMSNNFLSIDFMSCFLLFLCFFFIIVNYRRRDLQETHSINLSSFFSLSYSHVSYSYHWRSILISNRSRVIYFMQ